MTTSFNFDPRMPEFRANPYPFYDMLRENAPLFYWPTWGMWFLSRYDDCNTLLRNNALGHGIIPTPPPSQEALYEVQTNWLLFKNPPDHTRLRSLVHRAFTPRMVEQLRSNIKAITNTLLDKVQEAGKMDVVADLAYPLPVTVIATMLGIPAADHDRLHTWSHDLARSLDLTEETAVYDQASVATETFTAYLNDLVAVRRRKPTDDLLSALIEVEAEGERLSEAELYATCILLLVAGHETTINLISNGILALLRHPDQLEKLKTDSALIKPAVEELLRYDSPVQMTSRLVFEPFELYGQQLKRGASLNFLLGAANHDPEKFAEPNRLDITRDPNPHLAFGSGIHYCLGAPLARLEGQIAIQTLVQRMPDLHLAEENPPYQDNYILRGLARLVVRF